jgi:Abortive infection C-terminus
VAAARPVSYTLVLTQPYNYTSSDTPVGGSYESNSGAVYVSGTVTGTFVAGSLALDNVWAKALEFSAEYLSLEISIIENAIDNDLSLAIGSAKEMLETCCKTILEECGKPVTDKPDVLPLVRRRMEELKLLPDGVSEQAKGSKTIKGILGSLATIAQNLAELRNLYGTGRGKHGRTRGLSRRHAKLAVGAATRLAAFLFDTHSDRLSTPTLTRMN